VTNAKTVQLHLLRHGHAGDPMAWDGPDDQRPLSPKGEKQADRLGRFLAGVGFRPDAIITSPKLRAAQTAEIVAERLGVPVGVDDRLAEELGVGIVERILRDAGDPLKPVLIGHDPDFSGLVAMLCGSGRIPMKKAAFVRIDTDRPISPGDGTLRWLIPPDLLQPGRER
jgi:phosphohistidine phosphatase SixA